MAFPVDLLVETVQVVRSVSLEGLAGVIKALQDGQANLEASNAALADRQRELVGANADLTARLAATEAAAAAAADAARAAEAKAVADATEGLGQLAARLGQLEAAAQQQAAAGVSPAGTDSSHAQRAADAPATNHITAAAPAPVPTDADTASAGATTGNKQPLWADEARALAQRLAALEAAAALASSGGGGTATEGGTPAGLAITGETGAGGTGAGVDTDKLRRALEGKADRSELEALAAQVQRALQQAAAAAARSTAPADTAGLAAAPPAAALPPVPIGTSSPVAEVSFGPESTAAVVASTAAAKDTHMGSLWPIGTGVGGGLGGSGGNGEDLAALRRDVDAARAEVAKLGEACAALAGDLRGRQQAARREEGNAAAVQSSDAGQGDSAAVKSLLLRVAAIEADLEALAAAGDGKRAGEAAAAAGGAGEGAAGVVASQDDASRLAQQIAALERRLRALEIAGKAAMAPTGQLVAPGAPAAAGSLMAVAALTEPASAPQVAAGAAAAVRAELAALAQQLERRLGWLEQQVQRLGAAAATGATSHATAAGAGAGLHVGAAGVGGDGGASAAATRDLAMRVERLEAALNGVATAVAVLAAGESDEGEAGSGGVAGGSGTAGEQQQQQQQQQGLARLLWLVQRGRVTQKMDTFDFDASAGGAREAAGSPAAEAPAVQQRATTAVPGTTRGGPRARGTGASAAAAAAAAPTLVAFQDLEGRVRKMGGQVKQLQLQLRTVSSVASAAAQQRPPADGDHPMLSSRPAVFGYRCMACDRPLAALAETPGPWVPSGGMPLPPAPAPWDAPPLFAQPGGGGADTAPGRARSPLAAAIRRRTDGVASAAAGAGLSSSWDRGPQAWFDREARTSSGSGGNPAVAVPGPAAADLPGALVGPQLPPGGYRGAPSPPLREDGSLPQIVKGRTPAVSTRATREA